MLIVASLLLSSISLRQDEKIIVDLGLGMIDIFGMLITIFVGTQLVFREIDKKTIFILLSKPVSRSSFIVSKFFGLGAILLLITGIMFLVYIAVIGFSTDLLVVNEIIQVGFIAKLLLITLFSLLTFLLLLSLVIFFSSFMQPTIAAFSALTVFIIGHTTDNLRIFALHNETSVLFQRVADFAYFAFPNFSVLNLKNYALNNIEPTVSQLFAAGLGAVCWIILAVMLGSFFFSRKEF